MTGYRITIADRQQQVCGSHFLRQRLSIDVHRGGNIAVPASGLSSEQVNLRDAIPVLYECLKCAILPLMSNFRMWLEVLFRMVASLYGLPVWH